MSLNWYAPTEFIFHNLILRKYDSLHTLPNVIKNCSLPSCKPNIIYYKAFKEWQHLLPTNIRKCEHLLGPSLSWTIWEFCGGAKIRLYVIRVKKNSKHTSKSHESRGIVLSGKFGPPAIKHQCVMPLVRVCCRINLETYTYIMLSSLDFFYLLLSIILKNTQRYSEVHKYHSCWHNVFKRNRYLVCILEKWSEFLSYALYKKALLHTSQA